MCHPQGPQSVALSADALVWKHILEMTSCAHATTQADDQRGTKIHTAQHMRQRCTSSVPGVLLAQHSRCLPALTLGARLASAARLPLRLNTQALDRGPDGCTQRCDSGRTLTCRMPSI